MRKWGDEGFSQGNPEDADIEKASHNGPEEEGKNIGKNWIHLFSPPLYHREAAMHSDQNPWIAAIIIYFWGFRSF
jgi:hypothetical protein